MDYGICIICNRSLQLTTDNFTNRKYTKKSGEISIHWSSYCLDCHTSKTNEWRQNNKKRCRENEKRYRSNNVEKVKERKSAYKKKNKDKISEYNKRYRYEHKEVRRKQDKERRQNDIAFRLRKLISRSVQKAIIKKGSITKYLPYTFEELKLHLEKQFESWMSWQNHGSYDPAIWNDNDQSTWTWQLDHIIPQSILLYTSMEDENFKKCWALNNLRPLSSKQNIIDGASKVRHQ